MFLRPRPRTKNIGKPFAPARGLLFNKGVKMYSPVDILVFNFQPDYIALSVPDKKIKDFLDHSMIKYSLDDNHCHPDKTVLKDTIRIIIKGQAYIFKLYECENNECGMKFIIVDKEVKS
jgi:hypothetical protein